MTLHPLFDSMTPITVQLSEVSMRVRPLHVVCICSFCLMSMGYSAILAAADPEPAIPAPPRLLRLPQGAQQAVVPLERARGFLLVRLRINDKDAGAFEVNTATSHLIVDQDVADRVGMTTVP